jgi:hypothetical protein
MLIRRKPRRGRSLERRANVQVAQLLQVYVTQEESPFKNLEILILLNSAQKIFYYLKKSEISADIAPFLPNLEPSTFDMHRIRADGCVFAARRHGL